MMQEHNYTFLSIPYVWYPCQVCHVSMCTCVVSERSITIKNAVQTNYKPTRTTEHVTRLNHQFIQPHEFYHHKFTTEALSFLRASST
jgi:hypothetical protein